jgi:hypothetical protein
MGIRIPARLIAESTYGPDQGTAAQLNLMVSLSPENNLRI